MAEFVAAGKGGQLVASLSPAIYSVTAAAPTFSSAIRVSDGRYFAKDGIEIVNFGPRAGSEGRSVDESVSIKSLQQSARILDAAFAKIFDYSS